MKVIPLLLAVLATTRAVAHAAPGWTNLAATNRILMIDPSSMPVAGGKATLTIGPLQRLGGVYAGDYKIEVSPYFFKNENGRLAILVSDDALAAIAQGKEAAITGTATTSGQRGNSRHIDATAKPVDTNRGNLKLWFLAGDRQMVFEPAYHFADKGAVTAAAMPAETNRAADLPSGPPASYRATLDVTDKLP